MNYPSSLLLCDVFISPKSLNMNHRRLTIILALALIVSFFLPYIGLLSAYDVVSKTARNSWQKYEWLLVFVFGILIFISAARGRANPGWMRILPFVILVL